MQQGLFLQEYQSHVMIRTNELGSEGLHIRWLDVSCYFPDDQAISKRLRCHQFFFWYFINSDGVTQNTSNAKIPNLFLNNQNNDMLQECNPKLTEFVCWRSVMGEERGGFKQTLQFCSFQLNTLGVDPANCAVKEVRSEQRPPWSEWSYKLPASSLKSSYI